MVQNAVWSLQLLYIEYDAKIFEKHPVFIPEVEVDDKEGDRGGVGSDGPRPLTPEHRHLLRRKAYSFPFLCEKSWNSCDDEDEDGDNVGQRGKLVLDEVINDGGK